MIKKILATVIVAALTSFAVLFATGNLHFGGNKVDYSKLELKAPGPYFYYHFKAFFDNDKMVKVGNWDDTTQSFNVDVLDEDKYCALIKAYNNGNWKYEGHDIKINLNLVTENTKKASLGAISFYDLEALFKGNTLIREIVTEGTPFESTIVGCERKIIDVNTGNLFNIYSKCDAYTADQLAAFVFSKCKFECVFVTVK